MTYAIPFLPPGDGDAGFAGEIIDGRFDGAFLGGLSIEFRHVGLGLYF